MANATWIGAVWSGMAFEWMRMDSVLSSMLRDTRMWCCDVGVRRWRVWTGFPGLRTCFTSSHLEATESCFQVTDSVSESALAFVSRLDGALWVHICQESYSFLVPLGFVPSCF